MKDDIIPNGMRGGNECKVRHGMCLFFRESSKTDCTMEIYLVV